MLVIARHRPYANCHLTKIGRSEFSGCGLSCPFAKREKMQTKVTAIRRRFCMARLRRPVYPLGSPSATRDELNGLQSVKPSEIQFAHPNKPIVSEYRDVHDSTLPRSNAFRFGASVEPGSALVAVELSSKDNPQPGGGRHFCALGRKWPSGAAHPWICGK